MSAIFMLRVGENSRFFSRVFIGSARSRSFAISLTGSGQSFSVSHGG
ncbi:MAG: hypothetical protein A4E47_00966 [Methanosaeta sp. PtaU1.Bin028]|nr:MAG: hypothetical protein A4E47_00966 [Methanosaeta sp. PtaU1.Bin028]